ncbi:MAG: hypothetical protein FJ306_00440 [Planctomycetes bacterium]|nr:hypothetical protein [Planctomycetota bacterium]
MAHRRWLGWQRSSVDERRRVAVEIVDAAGGPVVQQARDGMVGLEFRRQRLSPDATDWESAATITIAFSNTRSDNR